ncbi:NDP-hexose 2,3-dehydratase family protein [Streptomyces sp. NRRL S-340]|uniref:NDP-hexose 2,3-dehydratase family protein n=1 Tax=Streptomyces sp. NRRL S-340 TaxID=1463901 RepID=UPI00056638CF|nr:NDP-hexose 2,3-dehydratase family protein [Streptomyces sp. NRRL S-340]
MTIAATPGVPSETTADLALRFALSAQAHDSAITPNAGFRRWFTAQRRAKRYDVRRVPFSALAGWHFQDGTGNLVHESGRFFSIEGLDVRTSWNGRESSWTQPIINQPEIGILGIVVKEFDGVLHCLMQAKMEPGNLETVQLSPTVQATRSNYTGVHGGSAVRYLEHFVPPRQGGRGSRVLFDSLQSEQGAWFLRKRNRNVVVEAVGEVPAHEDFVWLTLGQLYGLLHEDNVLNMDARTVLSQIPASAGGGRPLYSLQEVLGRLTEVKSRRELVQRSIPLADVTHWRRTDDEIAHESGHHFTLLAADIRATNREVTHWSQPLLAPAERGLAAFLVRRVDGVPHLLAQARSEAGVLNVAELGPTVQCQPGRARSLPAGARPRYLDLVLGAPRERILFDSVQSEEGGRFHHADNRYVLVETGDEFPLDVPEEFIWVTEEQLGGLLLHGNYVNIEARTLIAALRATRAVRGESAR